MLYEELLKILITESVSINSINDAIDTHTRIIINYHTRGENIATGARIIEVYAYGLTKAGNPVIRAFQPYGDTTSRTPSWKFFRLDRISYWKPTKQVFTKPASEYYRGIGDFNPNGDDSMSVVYKVAKFGNNTDNNEINRPINHSSPKLKTPNKNDEIFKTDTEKRMERLRQQLDNPIKLSDIKTKQGFKQYSTDHTVSSQSGPKLKQQQDDQVPVKDNIKQDTAQNDTNKNDIFKTDTERGMEKLRQQLQNPRKIDLSKISRR